MDWSARPRRACHVHPMTKHWGEGSVSGCINLGVVSLHLLQALMLGERFKRMGVDWKRKDGA